MTDAIATPTIEELQMEVRNLQVQLAANETRGEKASVQTISEDGQMKVSTVSQLREQLDDITQAMLLAVARSKRDREESERRQPVPYVTNDNQLEYRTPSYRNDALLSKETAIKLHGIAGWERLSNAEKAQALDVRQSDVDGLKLEDLFGSRSSSTKAAVLCRENSTLYKLAKAKAVKLGIFNS